MSPTSIEHNHTDPEFQAFVGNRVADPWSRIEPLLHFMLICFAFPAITLLVFLRPKLGYRMPKPWVLVSSFFWLCWFALWLNLALWGYTYARDQLGFGEFMQEFKQRITGTIPAQAAAATTAREEEIASNYDAPFPPDLRQRTLAERQAWGKQHYIADPKRRQQLLEQRRQEAERRQKEAEAQKQANYAAAHQPFRLHLSLAMFAVLMLAVGLWRRHEGKQLVKRLQWHTMSRGESYLSRILPLSEYAIQTYLEPGLIILLAIPYAYVSITLSLWLIYAALCVAASEMIVMELSINRVLDQFDGEVEARQMQEARRLLKAQVKEQRVAKTGGVRAAALSEDIQAALGLTVSNN